MKIRIVLFEQQKPLFKQHYHTLGMRAQLKLLQLFFMGLLQLLLSVWFPEFKAIFIHIFFSVANF